MMITKKQDSTNERNSIKAYIFKMSQAGSHRFDRYFLILYCEKFCKDCRTIPYKREYLKSI